MISRSSVLVEMKVIYDKNMKRGKILKRTMKLFCVISVIAVLGYFGFLHMNIQESIHQQIPENADYLMILGARVKGSFHHYPYNTGLIKLQNIYRRINIQWSLYLAAKDREKIYRKQKQCNRR